MKKYRSLISYLSICILILNIGLANAGTTNNDKILLCTSQGYIWVSLTEISSELFQTDINHNEKNIKGNVKIHKCPFCTNSKMDSDDFIQSFYGPKPYQSFYSAQLKPSVSPVSTNTLRYSLHQSRAPPIRI